VQFKIVSAEGEAQLSFSTALGLMVVEGAKTAFILNLGTKWALVATVSAAENCVGHKAVVCGLQIGARDVAMQHSV
jgi:hypothetical protein